MQLRLLDPRPRIGAVSLGPSLDQASSTCAVRRRDGFNPKIRDHKTAHTSDGGASQTLATGVGRGVKGPLQIEKLPRDRLEHLDVHDGIGKNAKPTIFSPDECMVILGAEGECTNARGCRCRARGGLGDSRQL
jgi:hypothetical protein